MYREDIQFKGAFLAAVVFLWALQAQAIEKKEDGNQSKEPIREPEDQRIETDRVSNEIPAAVKADLEALRA